MKRVKLRGGVEGEENKRGEGKKRKPGGRWKGERGETRNRSRVCFSLAPWPRGSVGGGNP